MNKRFDLNLEPRTTGKHFSRALRKDRKVPGVVYGSAENKNVAIYEGDIVKYNVRAYENALFNLKSSSEASLNGKVALLKEVIVHPVTRRPQHVDLFVLDMNKPVRISIEINFQGKPLGLADGGLLTVVNRQIEIECLPTQIPDNVTADISNLGVGDALHVSDLNLPAGLKLLSNADLTLAVVNIQEEEVIAAPVVEAVAAEGAAAAAPGAAGAAAPGTAGAAAPAAAAGKDAKPAAPAKK